MSAFMIRSVKKTARLASRCLASAFVMFLLHNAAGNIGAQARTSKDPRSPELRKCIAKCGEEFTKCRRDQITWKQGPATKCVKIGEKCAKKC